MTNKQIKKIVNPKLKIPNIIKIGEDDPTSLYNNNYLFFLNNKPVTEAIYYKYLLKHKLFFPPKEEEDKITHKPEINIKENITVIF